MSKINIAILIFVVRSTYISYKTLNDSIAISVHKLEQEKKEKERRNLIKRKQRLIQFLLRWMHNWEY